MPLVLLGLPPINPGALVAAILGGVPADTVSAQVTPSDSARFVALTQSMLDAITSGDIELDSLGLRMARASRPAERLYALDDRTFIRHGVRGFWLFERDAAGRVARLVNWRDNNAVVWNPAP